ncbi:hypothetical protein T265_15797, partial [Opisthorchis viverrini]
MEKADITDEFHNLLGSFWVVHCNLIGNRAIQGCTLVASLEREGYHVPSPRPQLKNLAMGHHCLA